MKKFSYCCCGVAAILSSFGMIICTISASAAESYHPLWVLSALLFGLHTAAMSLIANHMRVGVVGWQTKVPADHIEQNNVEE